MPGRIFQRANFKKAYCYIKKNGVLPGIYAAAERILENKDCYERRMLTDEELETQRKRCWKRRERFSILVPAYETDLQHFREMIASVLAQTYSDFELIIADASSSDKLEREMGYYKDSRLFYVHLPQNGGISENTNAALRLAQGSYIGLLDHDDTLEPDALYRMMEALEEAAQQGQELWLLYSDEDKGNGEMTRFYEPHRKPDFNLDLLLSNNYICHFLVMRAELMKQLGFRSAYDGAQDHDLLLRAANVLFSAPDKIRHLPWVLYHWRCHTGSTAENPESKRYAYEAGRRAVADFCESRGWSAQVSHTRHLGFFRVEYTGGALSQRRDLAAVGGRILSRGRVAGGAYEQDGRILYQGLPEHFSGYMHRAVLQQDVAALSAETMRIAPGMQPLWEQIQREETDPVRRSLRFGQEAAAKGYRLLWDPMMEKL